MSPQILEEAFNRTDFDRELAFKFFVIFSMFEHALKNTQFKKVSQNGTVEPDWDAFAQAINGQFNPNASPELNTAVNYFMNHPVKKQVFTNNQLTFIVTPRDQNISDAEWLSLLIRRVRNNLFHGGKVNYDRHRDTLLIQFAIVILESWAVLDHDVRTAIHQIH